MGFDGEMDRFLAFDILLELLESPPGCCEIRLIHLLLDKTESLVSRNKDGCFLPVVEPGFERRSVSLRRLFFQYRCGKLELLEWMLEPDAEQRCQYLFQNRNPQPSDSLKLCKYLENVLNDTQFQHNFLRHDSEENIQFLEQLAEEFEMRRATAVRMGRTVPQGDEPEWEPGGDSQ